MSFLAPDFRGFVSHVMHEAALHSPAAVELLLGTCAQESRFGHYRRQLAGGPAVGVFQMEPATFLWLRGKYSARFPELVGREAHEMEWDDRLATIMARLRYLVVREPIPPADDVYGLAHYWKLYYNTRLGRGTEPEFVSNYQRFVEGRS